MKDKIKLSIVILITVSLLVLGFIFTNGISDLQKHTLEILAIICGASALYCFVIGEISRNNSQMDKLWSVLPIAYVWIIAALGNMRPRLIIIAIIASLWGCRLTYNFAKKGAYSIKFWSGEEDYRWIYLRSQKPFTNKLVWAIFDLLFISIFQNVVVLGITLPMVAIMESDVAIGAFDIIGAILMAGALLLEIIADREQNKFQVEKYRLLKEGKSLEELPAPYNRGFNVSGLWGRMRHPNYLGEQSIWLSMYLFVIGAQVGMYGFFNWSIFGSMLLVLVFAGSSRMAESMSNKKYAEYKSYQEQVFKYLPIRKYKK